MSAALVSYFRYGNACIAKWIQHLQGFSFGVVDAKKQQRKITTASFCTYTFRIKSTHIQEEEDLH